MKWLVCVLAIALVSFLSGCSSGQLLGLPLDTAGESLNSPYAETEPQFVNGQYLVFISDRNGSQDVFLYDLKARQLIDLPNLNTADSVASHPGISSNGRYIVFASSRQGESDIYLYDREVQTLKNLTATLEADVRYPTISGDGERIAFESNGRGQWDIVVCDRMGKPLALSSE
ncbi:MULTISPECIES: PD40 domain-containing protein [unclassified Leptolyngbya]|uniref:PD40 domain-containing protein n=1 Tax=unclassified Leptolyngbya TaxID=2650499 RepID=UPI0016825E16|nr:TolB family protein [Leptolyngbya sp. FACHB-8]MBD2154682.1 TolB family protein [Leptolyngbya sp. FACHB-16]